MLARNPSATSTLSEDTADVARIEATLSRLCEMVGRRLREYGLRAGTVQLKLRYTDFSTITRAHSIARGTRIDTELFEEIRDLFRRNWKPGAPVRLLRRARFVLGRGAAQMELAGEGSAREVVNRFGRRGQAP